MVPDYGSPALAPPARPRLFEVTGLRVPVWALLATLGLGIALSIGGHLVEAVVAPAFPRELLERYPWIGLYAGHTGMLLASLGIIFVMRRWIPGDYGLCLPKGHAYVGAAVAWGLAFGVLMTLVDHAPELLAGVAPKGPYELSAANVLGWLSFEGVYVGFPEEIAFRGLLLTFLMAKMSGRVRFLRWEMSAAGVVLALLFALAHLSSFWVRPFWIAFGQQVYAVALGILYAYWFEKSRSLLAPIVGHNVSDVTEYALAFGLVALMG